MVVRSSAVLAVVLAGAWGALGCDASLAPVQPAPQLPPPSFATCQAAAGTTLYEIGVQEGSPSSLVTANGNLYFAATNPDSSTASIMSLPLAGGAPVALGTGAGYQLWLDGQAIDLAGLDDKLWQVPMSGGDATLVADGQTTGAPSYFVATAQAFDGANFYWDLRPQNGTPFWNVWQIPATGGAAQKLADLPVPVGPHVNWTMLGSSSYGVLLAYENFPQVGAFLMPPGGGTPQILPSPPPVGANADNELLGISSTAVLWDTEGVDPVTGGNLITLSLTDVTASGGSAIRPFWADRPSSLIPFGVRSWSGGDDGSWLISGFEPFDDGASHGSLWLVDAEGNGARIGCDPNVGDGPGIVTAALATPTAVYAVIGSSAVGLYDYRIVRLGR
jgi:hypothetical protein